MASSIDPHTTIHIHAIEESGVEVLRAAAVLNDHIEAKHNTDGENW